MEAAVFSGLLGVVVGAALTGLLKLLIDERSRFKRQTELVIALHAEIVASLSQVKEKNEPLERQYAIDEKTPFGIADETDFVFQSIKSDPARLPKDVNYPVIRYYKLAGQSNGLVRGLLEEAFSREQTVEAKRKHVRQVTELMIEHESAGHDALTVLESLATSRREEGLSARRKNANVPFPQENGTLPRPAA